MIVSFLQSWWILAKRPLDGPERVHWDDLRENWQLSSDGHLAIGPLLIAVAAVLALMLLIWTGLPGKVLEALKKGLVRTAAALKSNPTRPPVTPASQTHKELPQKAQAPSTQQPTRRDLFQEGQRAKIRVQLSDTTNLDQRLVDLGATVLGERVQTVTYYHPPDHRPQCAGMGLQLCVDRDNGAEPGLACITWFEPDEREHPTCSQEVQVTVGDDSCAAAFLKAVGFRQARRFEIARQPRRWKQCVISIDTVPHLGRFVEISAASPEHVQGARRALGLDSLRPIHPPYAGLLESYLVQHQIADPFVPLNPTPHKAAG